MYVEAVRALLAGARKVPLNLCPKSFGHDFAGLIAKHPQMLGCDMRDRRPRTSLSYPRPMRTSGTGAAKPAP